MVTLQKTRHNIRLPNDLSGPQIGFKIYDDDYEETGKGILRPSAKVGYLSLDFVEGELKGNTIRIPIHQLALHMVI